MALNEADVKDSESGVRIDMLPLAGSMPAYLDTERLEGDGQKKL